MPRKVIKYTREDYANSLLIREEKLLLRKALVKCNGKSKRAHKLNCPNDLPYGYSGYLRVLKKHNLC